MKMIINKNLINLFTWGTMLLVIFSACPANALGAENDSGIWSRPSDSDVAEPDTVVASKPSSRQPKIEDLPVPPLNRKSTTDDQFSMPVKANGKPAADENIKKTDSLYVIQAGETVMIKIYPEDEYIKGGQYQVRSEGYVTMPFIGKLQIGGKSIAEAEKMLTEIIDRDYLANPEVVIQIQEGAKNFLKETIVILGQVKKPGPIDLPGGSKKLTLLQAIALAGGFTDIANIKKIKVVRRFEDGKSDSISANGENIINGKDPDVELKPNDTVNVSESLF